MATKKTKYTVGLFVVIGTSIGILAIIWLGMSHYFDKGRYYVAYFDESVQGLDRDSPVKYRGVSVGRVDRIAVAPDGNLIEVIMSIEAELDNLEDVVARLKSVGITGIMFIELEHMQPEEEDVSPVLSFNVPYPVIKTKPSDIENFMKGIDTLLLRLNELDVGGISRDLRDAISSVTAAIEGARVPELSKEIRVLVARAEDILGGEEWKRGVEVLDDLRNSFSVVLQNGNSAIEEIRVLVRDNEDEISEALVDFRKAMSEATTMMEEGSKMVNSADSSIVALQRSLTVTAQNLEVASVKLNRLVDLVSDQPSQLLFGEPPAGRPVEP